MLRLDVPRLAGTHLRRHLLAADTGVALVPLLGRRGLLPPGVCRVSLEPEPCRTRQARPIPGHGHTNHSIRGRDSIRIGSPILEPHLCHK